jgi:hypothetical protein
MRTIPDAIQRVRAEYLEMPGLRLTADQVHRLCGVEQTMCQLALDSLVASKFLRVTSDGRYARVTERYSFAAQPGDGLVGQPDNPAPQLVQPDGRFIEHATLVLRQTERRRHRSDAGSQNERAQWVRQWNQ